MNDYDNPWQNRQQMYERERIRPRSFWQRHRWQMIAIISILLVVVFASTTIYLLIRTSVSPVATQTTAALPTKVAQTQAAAPTQAAAATSTPQLLTSA